MSGNKGPEGPPSPAPEREVEAEVNEIRERLASIKSEALATGRTAGFTVRGERLWEASENHMDASQEAVEQIKQELGVEPEPFSSGRCHVGRDVKMELHRTNEFNLFYSALRDPDSNKLLSERFARVI